MISETDAEFVERMDNDWVHDRIPNSDDAYRLFDLARLGITVQHWSGCAFINVNSICWR